MIKISNYSSIIVWLLGLILFNAFFFLFMGIEHTPSIWISYAFINIAICTPLISILLSPKEDKFATLANPLSFISSIYLGVEFILGIVCIIMNLEDYRITLFIQSILFCIYVILIFINVQANKRTVNAIQKQEIERTYVKNAASRLLELLNQETDKAKRYKIEKAYDIISTSPIKSHSSVKEIEENIESEIEKLAVQLQHGEYDDICQTADKISSLANLRNRKLMNNN